jgi:hypothetical protein
MSLQMQISVLAIDVAAGWAIAGANGKNTGANGSGAAYVFEHICPPI